MWPKACIYTASLQFCSIICGCCRAQRNIIHIWFQMVGILIRITLEISRKNFWVITLLKYPQIGIYQKPELAFTWERKIFLIITLRASSSCNIKYFNLLSELFTNSFFGPQKIRYFFPSRYLLTCSSWD